MIRRNWHILLVGAVFFAAAQGLDAVRFWEKVGLTAPHGLVFQGFLFLAFYAILSNTLFHPYLAIMHEREEQTSGKRRQCEATKERADRLLADYAAAIEEARLKSIRERELAGLRAEEDAKKRVDSARARAGQDLIRAKGALADEMAQARVGMKAAAFDVAADIVANAMGGAKDQKPMARAGAK